MMQRWQISTLAVAPPHHYHFTVYALNTALDVKDGLDKAALLGDGRQDRRAG